MNGCVLALLLPACLGLAFTGCGEKQRRTKDTGEAPLCAEGWLADRGQCVPEACGTGSWGDLPVDGSTVYVDAAAAEGGDGGEGAPLRSIQPALDLAGSRGGGLVAVAAGTYAETLALSSDHAGVQLAGRCRELVTLDASVGDGTAPGIDIATMYGEAELSGLRVVGSSYVGVLIGSGVVRLMDLAVEGSDVYGVVASRRSGTAPIELHMEGCELVGNMGGGLLAYDASTTVSLVDTTIRDSLPDAYGTYGCGIYAHTGATVTAEGCELAGNAYVGVQASESAAVVLVDTVVRDTLPDGRGDQGYGIAAWGGATLSASGCDLAGSTRLGVGASDLGTVVALEDTVIRGTLPGSNGEHGYGVQVGAGAVFTADGCELAGNTALGLVASDLGTLVSLVDTMVRDTRPDGDEEQGYGIKVQSDAALTAVGCELVGNTGLGIGADYSGVVALTDTVIRDTLPNGNGEGGYGIAVQFGAALTAMGCELAGNTAMGVSTYGPCASVALVDTVVRDTVSNGNGEGGYGIFARGGGAFMAQSCALADNTSAGVVASDPGTAVSLVDTRILDTLPDGDGEGGHGIQVNAGAALTAGGCELAGNAEVGAFVSGQGTAVALVDTVVRNTLLNGNGKFGYGIQVRDSATLTAEDCELVDNTTMGLLAGDSGTEVVIRDSSIRGTSAGSINQGAAAVGLSAHPGASVFAIGLLADDNDGPGLFAAGEEAWLTCTDCSLLGNTFAGAAAIYEANLEIHASTISGTREGADLGGGVGIYAAEQGEYGPPSLRVSDTTITDNFVAGAWLAGDGSYRLSGNTFTGGTGIPHGPSLRCGDGVYAVGTTAWDGGSGLALEGNALTDNAGAGLFLDAAEALLDGNTWEDNSPDLLVQGEACSEPSEDWDEAPSTEICPVWDRPACELEFDFDLLVEQIDPAMAPSMAPVRRLEPVPVELVPIRVGLARP